MKKPLFLSAIFIFSACWLQAQTTLFSENFNAGGAGWTLNVATGANAATQPNTWEINDSEGGVTPPGCGVASNGNPTLHITCTSLFCGSLITGAVYNAGKITNKRSESPAFSTVGYSNLTLQFNFISMGDGMLDNASVWYNDGSGWQQLTASIKSPLCGGGQGQWTAYSASLPASCNNNPAVKIGINWTNNGDNVGTDPSIAIDNITVTSPSTPLTLGISQNNINCFGDCTGSATVTPIGGTPPYNIIWTPSGGSGNTASSLCAGVYTCTVTDGGSGIATALVTISEPAAITSSQTLSICQGASVTVGTHTYSSTGIYLDTLTANNGCDSMITTNLTVLNNSASSLTQSACNSYTLNSTTYNSSGTYTQTLNNANGCDSVITLYLTINNATSSNLNASACNSYTLNSTTYNSSGTYTQTLTNANGCDSVITLYLTIQNASSNTITATACDAYTLNSITYNNSGTYTQTLTNAVGCDSTITLNLTIENYPDVTTTTLSNTITVNETGASYQWIDCDNGNAPIAGATSQSFTPTVNGNYAVIVNNGTCIDTSACKNINSLHVNEDGNLNDLVNIFPNPNDGHFTLTLPQASTIYIINALGESVYTTVNTAETIPLDLAHLPAGIYTVRIWNNNKTGVIKFVIK